MLDDVQRRRWRLVEYALLVVFAVYVLYFLTGFRFEALISGDTRQVDFRMWYLLPPQIKALGYPTTITGDWKISFPYLPSVVAMMLPLSVMTQTTAFMVWMVLQVASFAVVIWASLRLAGIEQSPLRLPIAAAAVFVVSAAIEWDLRAHNNNLIYLALVMLGLVARKTWIAAVLFAVTANLKLYSGVLIPGFLWRREYRLALMTALAAIILAVALPLLVFGPDHALKLFGSWINELLYTASPAGRAAAPLSLQKTAAALLATDPSNATAITAARCAQALWLALVAGYFLVAARPGSAAGSSTAARLCDAVVLLMLPLPISTWLVPYHGIVMLPAFVLIVSRLVDAQQPRVIRIMAGAACIGCIALRFGIPAWELRAGTLTLSLVLTLVTLRAIRMSDNRQARLADGLRPV
jgi:hypothetical protein